MSNLSIGACLLLVATFVENGRPLQTRAPAAFLIETNRAGMVEKGMPIDLLYEKVGADHLELVNLDTEGFFSPALVLKRSAGKSSRSMIIDLATNNARQWVAGGITVLDERYRTASGIGVGSTFGETKWAYKVTLGQGEGSVAGKVANPNVAFAMEVGQISEVTNQTKISAVILP